MMEWGGGLVGANERCRIRIMDLCCGDAGWVQVLNRAVPRVIMIW